MKILPKKIVMILLLMNFSGCSSIEKFFTNNKSLEIDSSPSGAAVEVLDIRTRSYIPLGKTPFLITKKILKKYNLSNRRYISFRIAYPGHVIEHFTHDGSIAKRTKVYAVLKKVPLWIDRTADTSSLIFDEIASDIQEINNQVVNKRFKSALERVKKLSTQYPKSYFLYDIKGSIKVLQGNIKEGITSYQKSLQLNPDNLLAKEALRNLTKGN